MDGFFNGSVVNRSTRIFNSVVNFKMFKLFSKPPLNSLLMYCESQG